MPGPRAFPRSASAAFANRHFPCRPPTDQRTMFEVQPSSSVAPDADAVGDAEARAGRGGQRSGVYGRIGSEDGITPETRRSVYRYTEEPARERPISRSQT